MWINKRDQKGFGIRKAQGGNNDNNNNNDNNKVLR